MLDGIEREKRVKRQSRVRKEENMRGLGRYWSGKFG
jgi:hypothetical protein